MIARYNYWSASNYIKHVAASVARMIDNLEGQGLNCSRLILIGHSLGAHVMGLAGHNASCKVFRVFGKNAVVLKLLKNLTLMIQGLDPARPLFNASDFSWSISKNDATHVEIIHTNANVLGLLEANGHSDFYVNGGTYQPGCWFVCSHMRAVDYFVESIGSNRGFFGKQCYYNGSEVNFKNCTGPFEKMGGVNEQKKSQGIFHVKTRNKFPFALGMSS